MREELSVLVRIDLEGRHVALVVTGRLAGANHQAVPPLVVRTRRMFPESEVPVDLHEAQAADEEAVDLLRWSLDGARPATGPVRITAPARRSTHPFPGRHASEPSGRHGTGSDRHGPGPHGRLRDGGAG